VKEAALGGLLIGLGAALLLVVNRRIAGVAGIVGGVVKPSRGDVGWRVAFLVGLTAGGLALWAGHPEWFAAGITRSPAVLLGAGVLVGVGTRLGNGCTSGHGLCGVACRSPRSIVATLIFMAVAAGVVFAMGRLA
jgi:uncharacterized membrane protein YedE/YeeE